MTERNQLKIVVQALGLYTVVHSMSYVSSSVARFITYSFLEKTHYVQFSEIWGGIKNVVIEPLIVAGLLLVFAWLLLAKTNWFVKAITDMSRRPVAPAPAE